MSFDVAADAYLRFMGRYSTPLADLFVDLVGVRPGDRVLDVGCGPGVLTGPLVARCGPEQVAAVDPSSSFVTATRDLYPEVDVREAGAESLPFDDDTFDAVLAQLVVHFMADPVAGLGELKRVTIPGGVVAASVWDHAGERTPLAVFWQAARELDPDARDESSLAGGRAGHLGELFASAGLDAVRESTVEASARFATFDEWWEPFTLGVGPAGAYAQALGEPALERLRARCKELLPAPPFTLDTVAWTARGTA
jgi:SAM-dependent methyltransferase